jgi:hypothetical protein
MANDKAVHIVIDIHTWRHWILTQILTLRSVATALGNGQGLDSIWKTF